jgi:predicted permease
MTWLAALDVLRQDIRYAWRSIARTPGFALLVVLTFTLGFGVNAAAFSVLDTLFLRPPAGIARPSELQRIWQAFPGQGGGAPRFGPVVTVPQYRTLVDLAGPHVQVALYSLEHKYHLGSSLRGPTVDVLFTTANYFPILGVRPARGRFYTPDEARIGNPARVVVLGHHVWQARFAGDLGIVGKRIRLDGETYTVIGIAPKSFGGMHLKPADVWIPISAIPQPEGMQERLLDSPYMYTFFAFARVPAGLDVRSFERQASVIFRENFVQRSPPGPSAPGTIALGPILFARGPGQPGQESLIITRLAGVAAIVLLIACANVVNLLLARAVRRRREIAVRLALGVSRARLVSLLTAETLLLALLAGVGALLAASWAGGVLRNMLLPAAGATSALDLRVATFTLAVALLAGLIAGLIPAFQASNPDLTRALKAGARDISTHKSRLRDGLVMAQAALSVVLLVGAALFVRSLRNVESLDIGYDADRLIYGSVQFEKGQAPPDAVLSATLTELETRLALQPGIERVARAAMPPMTGFSFAPLYIDGDTSSNRPSPSFLVASANYFSTVGMRFLRGATFDDRPGAPREVVVNDAMAGLFWPGRDPIGRCVKHGADTNPCYTVVGVVETARRGDVIEEAKPQYFFSLANPPEGDRSAHFLIVRARTASLLGPQRELAAALRTAFPTALPSVRTMADQLAPQYRPWQLGARLFTAFGLLALAVALVGIYSTLSYSVGQRTHEFGVRVALGARMGDVLKQVLREGFSVVGAGIAVGIVLALAGGRLIAALLYGVEPSDARAMLLASVTLMMVATIAAVIPAWRAARVDPNIALRAD